METGLRWENIHYIDILCLLEIYRYSMYVFAIQSIPYPFPLFFFFCYVSFLLYLFLSLPLFFCLSFICVFFFRYVCLPVNILLLCCKLGVVLRKGDVDRPRDIYGCLRKLTFGHTLTNRKSNMAMPGYTDPNSRTSRLSSAFPWGRGFTSVAGSGCAVSASLIHGFHFPTCSIVLSRLLLFYCWCKSRRQVLAPTTIKSYLPPELLLFSWPLRPRQQNWYK